jgi:nucleoid DNA-binding protein
MFANLSIKHQMNKVELIDHIAAGADISQLAAEKVLNSIIFRITDAVAMNEVVQIIGWGSFSQVPRTARIGRNPITGDAIQIEASVSVKFKPGTAFKNTLNQD